MVISPQIQRRLEWSLVFSIIVLWGCRDSKVVEPADTLIVEGSETSDQTDASASDDAETNPNACSSNEDCAELNPNADPCTAYVCSSVSGECLPVSKSDFAGCKSNNLCLLNAYCLGGECISEGEISCDDDEVCTTDSCDPNVGCVYTANAEPCNDSNGCTTLDVCTDGKCVGFANICDCETDEDCASSNDDDLCNGILECNENYKQCTLDPASIVICEPTADSCSVNTCVPESGACETLTLDNGLECDDQDMCTLNETCVFGSCTPQSIETCGGDDNPCVLGECDPETGCAYENLSGECDDGNGCTVEDSCAGGICIGGENTCACIIDSDCESAEDDDLCNGTLICLDNICIVDPDSLVLCDSSENTLCQIATCSPETGTCTNIASNPGLDCADDSACTSGETCTDGACSGGTVLDCNDGEACSLDTCNPLSGCIHLPSNESCDDGDSCTTNDLCLEDGCTGIPIENCGEECTVSADCNDDDQCTVDTCNALGLCSHTETGLCECDKDGDCNDQNVCTVGVCNTNQSCSFNPISASCQDGDPCTQADQCQNGECMGGAPLDCEDDNECTASYCEGGGCKVVFVFSPCEDGNACSIGDLCDGGSCTAGSNLNCDDFNPCTVDSCSPEIGCSYEALDGFECSPANTCGTQGVCSGATCIVEGFEGSCCTKNEECTPEGACLVGTCELGTQTCHFTPQICAEETTCNISYCEDNSCVTSPSLIANESFIVYAEDFSGGNAPSWELTSNNPEISWTPLFGSGVDGGFGLYLGNIETSSYDHGSVTAIAKMPPFHVPTHGAQLDMQVLKSVGDQNCPLDTLLLSAVNQETGTTNLLHSLCGSTSGFDSLSASLDAFAGENIQLQFLFDTGGAENNDGLGLVLDNLTIAARAPEQCCESGPECDDGDPCTNDSCKDESGQCVHFICGPGNPCNEPGCSLNPCVDDNCCIEDSDCDDLYECTSGECASGVCVYPGISCPETSNCIVDFCFQGNCIASGPGAITQGQVIFYETFDDGNANGWNFSSDSENVFWSLSSSEVASIPLSLYGGNPLAGNYDDGNLGIIAKTPTIALPQDTIILRLKVWADLQDSDCSKDVVQIYATSPQLGTSATLLPPPICQSTNGKFEDWEVDLSAFSGTTVNIGFSFATKGSQQNNGIGIFIDDVKVVAFPEVICEP